MSIEIESPITDGADACRRVRIVEWRRHRNLDDFRAGPRSNVSRGIAHGIVGVGGDDDFVAGSLVEFGDEVESLED